jgi:ABC-type transport system substrate-binding protein
MRRGAVALLLCAGLVACDLGHKRPAPLPVTPRRGGVLRVATTTLPSLDPMLARTASDLEAATALFTPLSVWDPVTLAARPGIAASWSATPDQKSWTFVIRQGASFSDGNPITARDVVFTYARIAQNPSSPSAGLLAGIASINPIGTDQVRIVLSTPLAVLPEVLANPGLGIVEKVSPPTGAAPVGSGPFTVAGRSTTTIHLVRAPGSAALLDGIDLVMFLDAVQAYAGLRSGLVDWSPVPPDDAAQAAIDFHEPVSRPIEAELFYGFNLGDPLVSDVRLRQAVRRGVDRGAIVANAYRGTALAMGAVVPSPDRPPCGDGCAYDPAKTSTSLLALYGPTGPPALTIGYDDDPTQVAVASALADGLRGVGIFGTLQPQPAASYHPTGALFRAGWVAKYPAPDGVLAPLFLSGSPDNITGFSSPDVDAAIAAARAEPDPTRRAADYRDAQAIVEEQAPVVPVVQFESHTAGVAAVKGLVVNAMGTWDPATVWLAR